MFLFGYARVLGKLQLHRVYTTLYTTGPKYEHRYIYVLVKNKSIKQKLAINL
jgi:hypothetical protein